MADAGGLDRPSFANFRQQETEGKPLVFVAQGPQFKDGGNAQQTPQEKAKRRRAQIRKAQAQHRERKADYIKTLELDVTQTRDATELVERECTSLKTENEQMRALLRQLGATAILPSAVETLFSVHHKMQLEFEVQVEESYSSGLDSTTPENFVTSLSIEKTVTLSIDETMKGPCYQIIQSPPPGAQGGSAPLPMGEEDIAINFILALEHICWDHFLPSDFDTPEGDDAGTETGHALLASTFCAATAPAVLYPGEREAQPMPTFPTPAWQATGLTLENLRLLASSILGGEAELTPVQGWFELTDRYGASALSIEVMEALKREFTGVVQCPHFGAVIEREAFESVVGRVMEGFALLPYEETVEDQQP